MIEDAPFPLAEQSGSDQGEESDAIGGFWLLRRSHLEEHGWEIAEEWDLGEKRPVLDDLEAQLYDDAIPGEYLLCSVTDDGKLVDSLQRVSVGDDVSERLFRRRRKDRTERERRRSESESDVWAQLEAAASDRDADEASTPWAELESYTE